MDRVYPSMTHSPSQPENPCDQRSWSTVTLARRRIAGQRPAFGKFCCRSVYAREMAPLPGARQYIQFGQLDQCNRLGEFRVSA